MKSGQSERGTGAADGGGGGGAGRGTRRSRVEESQPRN